MAKRAILCGVLLMLSAPLGADNRLTIQVSPAVAFAPANLVVKTMIQADHENRSVEIVAESDSFYRSSQVELDGEKAPRTTMFEFRSVPGGTYDVAATLFNASGKPLRVVHTQVDVIPAEGR